MTTTLIIDGNEIGTLQCGPFRKSTFSLDGNGSCVAVAPAQNESVLIQNTNRPEAGALLMPRSQFAGWLDSIKSGQLDALET